MRKTNLIFIYIFILALFFAGCKNKEQVKLTVKDFQVNQGDTLGTSLKATGLPQNENDKIISSLSKVFNPRYCKAGDSYELVVDSSNNWQKFTYKTSGIQFYNIQKTSTGIINSYKITKSTVTKTYSATGTIKSSLWEAMRAKNLPPELIISYAEIFSWQIDFLTETRVGDTYKLVWDRVESEDGKIVNDTITGAQYISGGKTHTAILFVYPDKKSDYYNIQGESLRRAFLKAPLQFRRISSFFTRARYHPILKIFRPHLGIDYAAPSGTPISSIGEGRVISKGWGGGFGNLLKIRHSNGYETWYGHMSHFASNIRLGSSVSQGQVIGYVGMTGLATGPHLDFRIQKDGSFINFLTMKLPVVKNIEKKYKESFSLTSQKMLSEIAKIR